MGQSGYSPRAVNMKMLVVLALMACVVAEPEAEASADPYYLGGYGGYRGYGGYGLGYSRLGYGGLYGGYRYRYGKREAEAEPEAEAEASADPYYLGGYGGTEDMEDTAWDTLVWDTLVSDTLVSDTEVCMEDTEDTAWDTLLWDTLVLDTLVSDTEVCTEDTEDTDTDMASVRLRLSPRLMLRLVLIPTTLEDTEDMEDMAWDTLL